MKLKKILLIAIMSLFIIGLYASALDVAKANDVFIQPTISIDNDIAKVTYDFAGETYSLQYGALFIYENGKHKACVPLHGLESVDLSSYFVEGNNYTIAYGGARHVGPFELDFDRVTISLNK